MVSGMWFGVDKLLGSLGRFEMEATAAARETVVKTGAAAVRYAHQNFSGSHKKGQPHTGDKPNVVTGYLRRSITMRPALLVTTGLFETRVEVNAVYGRRVELGLRGADSLGRVYNQPGYPYFKPAVDKAVAEMPLIAKAAFTSHFARLL